MSKKARWWWIGVVVVVGVCVMSRLVAIGLRPIHHDESMFAWYAFFFAEHFKYTYMPILHGPLMLFVVGFLYRLLGDSDFSMRLAPALMSVGLLLLALMLRRPLGKRGVMVALILLCVSPPLMFYGRFFRHDIPLVFMTLLLVIVVWRAYEGRGMGWTLLVPVVATLMVCIKENSLIVFFIFATYLGCYVLWDWFNTEINLPRQKEKRVKVRWWLSIAIGAGALGLFALVYHKTFYPSLKVFNWLDIIRFKAPAGDIIKAVLILGVFIVVVQLLRLAALRKWGIEGVCAGIYQFLQTRWYLLLAGVVVSLVIYATLFTSFFQHPAGFFKRLPQTFFDIYEQTFSYWWGQHKQHRIKGPFHFYMTLLLLYEFPGLVFAGVGILLLIRRSSGLRFFAILWIALWLVAAVLFRQPLEPKWWDQHFHLTSKWHLFIGMTLLLWTPILGFAYWNRKEKWLAFFNWWWLWSVLMYSYAGEKVPWVTVHISVPLLLAAGIYAERFFRSETFRRYQMIWLAGIALLVLWNVRNCVLANFYFYDTGREKLLYAQTHRNVKEVLKEIDRLAERMGEEGKLKVIVQGEAVWPFRWYYRNNTNFVEVATPQMVFSRAEREKPPVILVNYDPLKESKTTQENYKIYECRVRTWWQPGVLNVWQMAALWRLLIPAHQMNKRDEERRERTVKEWKDLFNYLQYRKTFDPWKSPWPTWSEIHFAFGVRKDLVAKYGSALELSPGVH